MRRVRLHQLLVDRALEAGVTFEWNTRVTKIDSRQVTAGSRQIPYTWLVDPAPLPPHAAIPELNLTDWQQLKALSQKERDLILKVSGFSENAWGAKSGSFWSDAKAR